MGRNEKIAASALIVLAAVSLFISFKNLYYNHTKPVPDFGGIYTEGLLGQPTYINPLLARTEPDLSLTKLVFSGLYKYDSNGQLVPDLANGMPQISPDQKQYTINLKPNVKWHNGKALTADDIIFTIQTLKDPTYKSPLRGLWQTTLVEKLSDSGVKFTTKDISGPFINNLTLPILPKGLWLNVDAQNFLQSKYNLEAIGSGPYAIKEIKKLPSGKIQQITLESKTDYYGGRAKIDQIIFKFYDTEDDILNAFQSREILGFGFTPLGSSLNVNKEPSDAQVLSVPLPQYQIAFFNLNNKILSDGSVRQALYAVTDDNRIIDQVFKGNARLPSSPLLYNNQAIPVAPKVADIALAEKLLDAAGWKLNEKTKLRESKKGSILEITIITNDVAVNSKAAEILAEEWRQLNIKVNLSVIPTKQLMDAIIKPRNFDVLVFPQKFNADPDPFLFWHSSQTKDPGFNLTGFSDPAADKLITDARSTTDKKIRTDLYKQFNDLVASKYPVIFLDQTLYIYTTDNSIQNLNLSVLYDPSLRFNSISDWYMATKRVWK